LARCAGCELLVSPSIWASGANEGFEADWFEGDYDPARSSWVRLFQMCNDHRTLKRLRALALPGNRLLEIGVGSGSLLRSARSAGFDVMGCDLSEAICTRIKQRYAIPMHCGYVADLPKAPSFDVVVMNHVLEHLPAPVDVLRELRMRMAPGALLHVAVPNVACPEARLPGWGSYEPYHLIYFTPLTLRTTLARAGFHVERETTHESFSGWFLTALRTLLGMRRDRSPDSRLAVRRLRGRSAVEHAYYAAMLVFGASTWPIRIAQAAMGTGDEVICMARVPRP